MGNSIPHLRAGPSHSAFYFDFAIAVQMGWKRTGPNDSEIMLAAGTSEEMTVEHRGDSKVNW